MSIAELTEKAQNLLDHYHQISGETGTTPWNKEDIMKGFVVDVGDLMRLVMAKEGKRIESDFESRIAHELADCLWSVLLLAKNYGVDLEKELIHMVDSRINPPKT